MSYNKPPASNLPFVFTSSGYVSPNPDNIPFNFTATTPIYHQTADLQAAINVMGLYQEETYTYTKECPTIVVGYGSTGVPQILQLPCLYGGIRDIGSYIYGNPTHVDISAYIFALDSQLYGQANLNAYIKSTIQATLNLGASTFGYLPIDLQASIHSFILGTKDLATSIQSMSLGSLSDLAAILNVIEIRDLSASLTGILFSSSANMLAGIFGYLPINLPASITPLIPWTDVDLSAYIKSVYTFDLSALIQSFTTLNLSAFMNPVGPVDLLAQLHGWDMSDLSVSIIGAYGPYDLQAYINGTGGFKNLSSFIRGMIQIAAFIDLSATLCGTNTNDLIAAINSVTPIDLIAYLNPSGGAIDLPAYIVPKTIYLSKVLQISLLEHKNLRVMINSSCFGSGYNDLYAYVRSIEKLDLRAVIYILKHGEGDITNNLAAYINTSTHVVEDVINVYVIPQPHKYVQLKLSFDAVIKPTYRIFDTIDVFFGTPIFKNLSASINGILTSKDLQAIIIPVFQWNYRDLPLNVNPRTHQIVIDFNDHWREAWRRFVEIFFYHTGTGPYSYFYVSGDSKVYKYERDRHWAIWAKSYNKISDSMIERSDVRHKYIFKMSQYANIDEAVRDLIDRVSFYRRVNLSASITAVVPLHKNLTAYVLPIATIRRWSKNLHVSITGV